MRDGEPTQKPVTVVGVGASAGGLEALELFFDNVPPASGMAYVVVQHLSPDFKSIMGELLARHTRMPICTVENGVAIEPDRVYLIPPGKEMIISDGRLLLSDRDPQTELTLPVDVFFRSLAQDCGRRAAAVVLSGGGTDGSRGLQDVHAAGGVVIVQDPETAQFDGMPRAAVEAGVADDLLPPAEIPRALIARFAERQALPTAVSAIEPHGLSAVYAMLEEEFGINFTHYKPSTVTRRIERRLVLARSNDIDEYVRRLRRDHDELDLLYRDLLIGVTCFFRDPSAFELLEKKILPELLDRTPPETPLRVWVAGCATGEEAYSLAIVLHDLMETRGPRAVKIFATDVHRGSLERAANAMYDEAALANLSEDRIRRYFRQVGNLYQVVPDLRQMIVYAQHDVVRDAPFTRVDLITCRNLLIYLQPAVQQKVLSLFHFALNRDGVLFLGPSETTASMGQSFTPIDKAWRLYRKYSDARTTVDRRFAPVTAGELRIPVQPAGRRYSLAQLLSTYDAILDDMMPPSLLVNDRGELVHSFGGASKFLRPRDGRQELDVLDFVDGELKMVLVGGLKRALTDPSTIVYNGVRIAVDGKTAAYKVMIRRVGGRNAATPNLLVSFEPVEQSERPGRGDETEVDLDQVSRQQLGALEAELAYTKENLQSAIEELETSNEELQASNEELQTSNEELQSTNEELQSVNEELYTVNAEYQRKIAELTELTNDMDNLLASTDVGTIFLDDRLRIRKFTPQIAKIFDLVPHDVDRSIETFAHKVDHPELVADLKRVLQTGTPIEREMRDLDHRSFFLRILPYRVKGTVAGVVLTAIDVTVLKQAEDALFHERHLLNSLLQTMADAIYFKDANGRFIRVNETMAARLGLKSASDAIGKTVFELPDHAAAVAMYQTDEAVLRTGQAQHYSLERRVSAAGVDAWDVVSRLPLRDREGRLVGVIAIFRDVTEQKRAEEKITEGVRRRDQFLAMLSHELRNPLGAIVTASALLKGETQRGGDGRLLEVVNRQSRQMARLLDDLLEASRVTQNKIELRKTVTDLRAALDEACEVVRPQLLERGIQLALDISAEPIKVDADPARLQQIHVNLLSNAVKYTQRGGHVWISGHIEGDRAVVRVRDDGAGIPPDMLDSVFDLFVQSNRTLDRAAGGLGVGLTLVRSLVEMHGGVVEAHSAGEGQGSEFIVRLPLAKHAAAAEPAPEAVRAGPHRRPVPAGARVVIVEDNADSRELLCELLHDEGYDCRSVGNGKAALDVIHEFEPHIALLDVGLPEMDGFELARRLRAMPETADIHLVAITGYGRASDRIASREAGFDEHLVKPVQPDELLKVLARIQGQSGTADGVSSADGAHDGVAHSGDL
ncbi:MAG TPA: chemotaxis protein CheB [Polyangia bacterium]|nr:chemotaxis protein CheB [Polyangia bacterium]HVY37348.1 chemotaxis protein CheB [Polyangia bacterium]